jgi:hypothetical protein
MKSVSLLSIIGAASLAFACGPKAPSYSNINLNKNAPAGASATASPDSGATNQGQGGPQPPALQEASPSSQSAPIKLPAFFDAQKGEIKDLPTYPSSTRLNVQYGPLGGFDSAMIVLQAGGSIEQIAAFYDRAIKSNGWTVTSDVRDTDRYRVEVKKGENDTGVVQASKPPEASGATIVISRFQKP